MTTPMGHTRRCRQDGVVLLVRKLAVLGPTPMKHWQRFNGRTGVEFKALQGEPVKIGSPHFMDFGENPEHSPDGKA